MAKAASVLGNEVLGNEGIETISLARAIYMLLYSTTIHENSLRLLEAREQVRALGRQA